VNLIAADLSGAAERGFYGKGGNARRLRRREIWTAAPSGGNDELVRAGSGGQHSFIHRRGPTSALKQTRRIAEIGSWSGRARPRGCAGPRKGISE